MIDKLADVADVADCQIGEGTKVWQFVAILKGAQIGNDCNICAHVLIEGDVILGDRVTVKSGVQLWDGLRIEDDWGGGDHSAGPHYRLSGYDWCWRGGDKVSSRWSCGGWQPGAHLGLRGGRR